MPLERKPKNPVAKNHVVANSVKHRVKDGESWHTLADRYGMSAEKIIRANFQTMVPEEINWYLRHYVGCNKPTRDGKNWMFSSSASPGIIQIPPTNYVFEGDTITVKPPTPKDFEIEVELKGNSDDDVLTPLKIPAYDGSATKDTIAFKITVKKNPLHLLTATVRTGSTVVFQKNLPTSMHAVGTHEWHWDGYSSAGILDTRVLRDSSLNLTIEGVNAGKKKSKKISFDNSSEEQDWVDVKIDKKKKVADIEVRVDLKNGGEKGVGEEPPDDVKSSASFKHIPASDPRRKKHTRLRNFARLQRLVTDGIKRYWSGKITVGSDTYTANVTAISSSKHSMDDINLVYNTNREWLRSSNPGSVRGFYSLFGNFVPERIAYNVGWIEYSNGWFYQSASTADKEFSETAAHEIGHEILSAYGGDTYSYSHRGTSTVVTQTTKSVKDGGIKYPKKGSIDLMKYHNGTRPGDFYSRVQASEKDIKSLIYLARVEFDD